MSQQLQGKNQEQLNQLSIKELVEIILTQQEIIGKLNQEIEKLKISRDLDSKISSKPPSSDLLKKPEKKTDSEEKEKSGKKRSPGGQLGPLRKNQKRIWSSRPLRSVESGNL